MSNCHPCGMIAPLLPKTQQARSAPDGYVPKPALRPLVDPLAGKSRLATAGQISRIHQSLGHKLPVEALVCPWGSVRSGIHTRRHGFFDVIRQKQLRPIADRSFGHLFGHVDGQRSNLREQWTSPCVAKQQESQSHWG